MTIAQSYIACMGMSAALFGLALVMIFIGVFRRGSAAELDDSAAWMLIIGGGVIVLLLIAFWLYAGPRMPPGVFGR